MLQIVDAQWKDHLYSLDHLKEGIGLRGYGQRDPLVEYKKESFDAVPGDEGPHRRGDGAVPVAAAAGRSRRAASARRRRAAARRPPQPAGADDVQRRLVVDAAPAAARPPAGGPPRPARTGGDDAPVKTVRRDEPKVGRNDPCWCGSGKKYKKCHGA